MGRVRSDRIPETKPCSQCGVLFQRKGAGGRWVWNAIYCETCMPLGTQNEMMGHRYRIAEYGVDKFMLDAMYFEQDGKCLICNDREATAIDHCHETGRVRGLLCLGCNTLLGFLETPGRMDAALAYKAEGVY